MACARITVLRGSGRNAGEAFIDDYIHTPETVEREAGVRICVDQPGNTHTPAFRVTYAWMIRFINEFTYTPSSFLLSVSICPCKLFI